MRQSKKERYVDVSKEHLYAALEGYLKAMSMINDDEIVLYTSRFEEDGEGRVYLGKEKN
jgi:hypothetical protein